MTVIAILFVMFGLFVTACSHPKAADSNGVETSPVEQADSVLEDATSPAAVDTLDQDLDTSSLDDTEKELDTVTW